MFKKGRDASFKNFLGTMRATLFLFYSCFLIVTPLVAESLWKPKTIVVPMIINIGGKMVPLGDVCLVPMEMFLNKFNQQSQFLPEYSLVAEITDDQCSGIEAVRKFIPEYLSWKSQVDLSDIDNNSSVDNNNKMYLPRNVTFQHRNASTAIRVPFFSGPLCSGVCQAISQYAQYFNLIEVSMACVTPKVDNRKLYPNFYRLNKGTLENAIVNIAVAQYMNWTKVAIISDTAQYTYEVSSPPPPCQQNNCFF